VFPQLIGIGLFFLAVPGLALMLAPTVFIYTATFAIVRRYLPITHARALNLVAAFITLGVGVLVPLPLWLVQWRVFHQAATGDVVPNERVVIRGDVLLNNDKTQPEYVGGKTQVRCDALCAALLDTPGVGTVTIAHKELPTSYRLLPKGEPKGAVTTRAVALKTPEEILQFLPEKSFNFADFAARKAAENAIIAHWGLRLVNDATLSVVPTPQHHDLTITMSYTSRQGMFDAAVKQVDVRDREGRLLLRRQHVTATRVFMPLLLLPGDVFARSGQWGLARFDVETHDRFWGKKPTTVLFEDTTLARPSGPGQTATAGMRDRLAAALMQPGAPADLALAGPWLATINWPSISDGDLELLGKLIADTRVKDLPDLYGGYTNLVRAELRGPIVARLINPATVPQLRHRLNTLVQFMPPGTFAVPTPDEVALRNNPLLRSEAPALVQRLADQGKEAVPELARILQEEMQVEPWPTRQGVLTAVSRAFVRLGPDAASALPLVLELFDELNSPLAVGSGAADGWRAAMVSMGRPIDEVPFPPSFTAAQIASSRAEIERILRWSRDHFD
jgi:hypothetical protein